MLSTEAALHHAYDSLQVALSILVAVAASYAALELAGRVTATRGRLRAAWLAGGGTAMGIGIWSMHYVGMLAFHLPVRVLYYWPGVLVSLLVGIAYSLSALFVVSRPEMGTDRTLVGGVIQGCGIASLHYISMAAMRMAAMMRFNFGLVALSVVFAILFSLAALWLAFHFRGEITGEIKLRIGAAIVMGAAICAMHYTGMAAADFFPSSTPDMSHVVNVTSVGTLAIAAATLVLLIFAVLACYVSREFESYARQLNKLNQELEHHVVQRTTALEETKSELAHISRMATMGELAASIAHEINQPLAAVVTDSSAALRWLAMQPPEMEEARQALTRSIREANRAGEVIIRIRALLKKATPELSRLDVNEVIREVLRLAGNELVKAGVTVRTELEANVPAVLGDRVQLQQVLLNLIMNSIDAMSAAHDRPRELWIKTSMDAEGVWVVVEDTGVGLGLEAIDSIFRPFYTSKPHGIGMGLTISRSIVEAHGGRLSAEPRSPYGAVFRFLLPRADNQR
jgi:NO-binding membrane sensor protein with MHYT domain/nitrogen-specific signal transduction histidine kinase